MLALLYSTIAAFDAIMMDVYLLFQFPGGHLSLPLFLPFSLCVCVAGTNSAASGSNGVISFGTPNSFQQYYSPTFGQFGAIYAATLLPSGSSTTPQVISLTFH